VHPLARIDGRRGARQLLAGTEVRDDLGMVGRAELGCSLLHAGDR
jgi:hypothetical protein